MILSYILWPFFKAEGTYKTETNKIIYFLNWSEVFDILITVDVRLEFKIASNRIH